MTVADRVLDALGPGFADRAGPLLRPLLKALTVGLDDVDDLVSGEEGWGAAFDLERTPAPAWLGQLAGVQAPPGTLDEQRAAVAARGPGRGTRQAIVAAARSTLTGTRVLVFTERSGSAYHFDVASYAAETADPTATQAAIAAAKPAGLTFTYTTRAGQSYQDVLSSGATYQDIRNQGLTYQQLLVTVPDPGAQATYQQVRTNRTYQQLTSNTYSQVLTLDLPEE